MRLPRVGTILGISGLLCLSVSSSAQAPPSPPSPPAQSFASEPYLLTTADTIVTIKPDGTETRVLTFAGVLQSEAAIRQSSVVAVSFASHAEHADFTYVRVIHADGTKDETPVSSAIEQPAPVTQEAPLYSDLEIKQIPVRSLLSPPRRHDHNKSDSQYPCHHEYRDEYVRSSTSGVGLRTVLTPFDLRNVFIPDRDRSTLYRILECKTSVIVRT